MQYITDYTLNYSEELIIWLGYTNRKIKMYIDRPGGWLHAFQFSGQFHLAINCFDAAIIVEAAVLCACVKAIWTAYATYIFNPFL